MAEEQTAVIWQYKALICQQTERAVGCDEEMVSFADLQEYGICFKLRLFELCEEVGFRSSVFFLLTKPNQPKPTKQRNKTPQPAVG